MDRHLEKEKEDLFSIINSFQYDSNRFSLFIAEDKKVFAIISPNSEMDLPQRIMAINTVYLSIIDVDHKIKFSLENSINAAYSEIVQKGFNFTTIPYGVEWFAYYNIENAVFRLGTLWDLLAQLYNQLYPQTTDYKHIYCEDFFKKASAQSSSPVEVKRIHEYFLEEDDISSLEEWKGNHKYVHELRNKFTHRNSPTISIGSNFDFTIKEFPSYQLRRVVGDYGKASFFINSILTLVEEEIGRKSRNE